MKKIIISGLCFALLPIASYAGIARITSYNDLINALQIGHRVSIVIDSKKCVPVTPVPKNSADATALLGLSFNNSFFLTYRDDNDPRTYVATIATNAIVGSEIGSYRRYKRVKVYDDNSVETYSAWSDFSGVSRGDYKQVCQLSAGHDNRGASLFDYDAAA